MNNLQQLHDIAFEMAKKSNNRKQELIKILNDHVLGGGSEELAEDIRLEIRKENENFLDLYEAQMNLLRQLEE